MRGRTALCKTLASDLRKGYDAWGYGKTKSRSGRVFAGIVCLVPLLILFLPDTGIIDILERLFR